MTNLEEMIRQKQDQLRGRPEDWIDHVGAHRIVGSIIGLAIVLTISSIIAVWVLW